MTDNILLTTLRICLATLLALCTPPLEANAHARPADDVLRSLMDKGEQAFAKGHNLEAIKHFIKARQLADDKNLADFSCLSRYNIGVCYFMMSENGEALHNYYEAYKICHDNNLDWSHEMKIVNGIAGVYFEQEDYTKAHELVLPYYHEARQKHDTLALRTFALDLALLSNKLHRFADSERYSRESKAYFSDTSVDMGHCLAIEAEALFMQKRYDEVERVAKQVLGMKKADVADRAIVLIYLINIYTDRKQFDLAFSSARQAQPIMTLKNKSYFFSEMARLYAHTGNVRGELASKDSVILYTDSITRISNRQLLDNSRMQLEVLKFTSDMDRQMEHMRQRQYLVAIMLCVCVLLLLLAFMVVRNQRAKSRHQHELMALQVEKQQREKQMAEERMRSVELEANYRQEIMNRTLEQKQREISATTMFVSSRNELIEDLLKYLESDIDIKSEPVVATITQHLRHLLKGNDDHDKFLVNFEAANPGFMQELQRRHPSLLSSDLRFLAYVRMNMQNKEIASLLNINPESCRRRKIRLSKKLGLESSADLYSYILGI